MKAYLGRYLGHDEYLYRNKEQSDKFECVVEFIADGSLKVSYEDEGEQFSWVGTAHGPGHWELIESKGIKSKATLHQLTPNSNLLEGSWREDGEWGMWRIELPTDSSNHSMG